MKKKSKDKWNIIQDVETSPNSATLPLKKKPNIFNERKRASLITGAEKIGFLQGQRLNWVPYLVPWTNLKSKRIKGFHIETKILNVMKNGIGKTPEDIGVGKFFLNKTRITPEILQWINNWNHNTLKFLHTKENTNKVNWQLLGDKKVFSYFLDKGLISRIYKQLDE